MVFEFLSSFLKKIDSNPFRLRNIVGVEVNPDEWTGKPSDSQWEYLSFIIINHHQSSLFIIIHQSPIINHQSSIINHQSSIINHQSSIINHQSSITNHQSSIINHQSSIINHHRLFIVSHRFFVCRELEVLTKAQKTALKQKDFEQVG